MKLSPEVQKEITRKQEKQLKAVLKQLSGSERKSLTEFMTSGQVPGSKTFKALKPKVQKQVLKLNITSMDIIINKKSNPLSNLRMKLVRSSYKSMLKALSK